MTEEEMNYEEQKNDDEKDDRKTQHTYTYIWMQVFTLDWFRSNHWIATATVHITSLISAIRREDKAEIFAGIENRSLSKWQRLYERHNNVSSSSSRQYRVRSTRMQETRLE